MPPSPSSYTVKTVGKEPISLAGLVNLAPGRDVKVDLEAFSDAKAAELDAAVQSAVRGKLITILKTHQRGLAGGGTPAYGAREIKRDTVVRKPNQPTVPSTGVGSEKAVKDTVIRTVGAKAPAKTAEEQTSVPSAKDPARVAEIKQQKAEKEAQNPAKVPEATDPTAAPVDEQAPATPAAPEAPAAPAEEAPPAPEAPAAPAEEAPAAPPAPETTTPEAPPAAPGSLDTL